MRIIHPIYRLANQQQHDLVVEEDWPISDDKKHIRSAANYPHSLPFNSFLWARRIFCIKNCIIGGQNGYPNSNNIICCIQQI